MNNLLAFLTSLALLFAAQPPPATLASARAPAMIATAPGETGDTTPPAIATATSYTVLWAGKAPMTAARDRLALAAAEGKLYAIGGSVLSAGSGSAVATVEEYDPSTDRWTTKANMPTPRFNIGAVTAPNGKIYVFGSWQQVEAYDPVTNSWATKADMPTPRFGPGVALGSNGKIYVIGGGNGSVVYSTVEEYDPATNTWATKASMPTPRYNLGAATAANGKIYAAGGFTSQDATGNSCCPTAVVEEYDPASDTWAAKGQAPSTLAHIGLVTASNGRLYAIGEGPNSTLEYDPAANSWEAQAGMPTPRWGVGAAMAANGKIYAVGGGGPVATTEEATIEATINGTAAVRPANSATGVAPNASVIITFSEDVVLSGADYSSTGKVRLLQGNSLVPGAGSYSSSTLQYTITPSSNLTTSTAYTVFAQGGAGGVADLAGNTMVADFSSSFTTAPARQLAIIPPSPVVGQPFSVTVQVRDGNGALVPVSQPTGVILARKTGTGDLAGNTAGLIPAGRSDVRLDGLTYNAAESGVVLTASRTSGDPLPAGDSAPFTVRPVPPPFAVTDISDAPDTNRGDGVCASATGVCTLRAAIEEANALPGRHTVTVPAGTYILTGGELQISGDFVLDGAGRDVTIIDGNGTGRVLATGGSDVQISGVKIQNGFAVSGAGVENLGQLALNNVQVVNNRSTDFGGGIRNTDSGILTLNASVGLGNTAGIRGGGGIRNTGQLTLNDSLVKGNQTPRGGGGINNARGLATLNSSLITENTAGRNGGGIAINAGGVVKATRTAIIANSAGIDAGGILNQSTLELNESLVARNTAVGLGGGIRNRSSVDNLVPASLQLVNSTVAKNSALLGGAIYTSRDADAPFNNSVFLTNGTIHENSAESVVNGQGDSVSLKNTIIASTTGPACSGLITSLGGNLATDTTCGLTAPGDLPGRNPLLGPLQNNGGLTDTHALLAGSPAIDAGSATGCPATDQRGDPRPIDGDGDGVATCDIGAYEAPLADPDIDGDGIRNTVDTSPTTPMSCDTLTPFACTNGSFSDVGLGGATTGQVISKEPSVILTVRDESPNPAQGVRVSVAGSGKVSLKLQGTDDASIDFFAPAEAVLTQGSAVVAVLQGTVTVTIPTLNTRVTVNANESIRLLETTPTEFMVIALTGNPVAQVTDGNTVMNVGLGTGASIKIVEPSPEAPVTITAATGTSTVSVNGQPPTSLAQGQTLATDTTAPLTSTATSPAPNTSGWHKTDVTITLTAADVAPSGPANTTSVVSGVKEIHHSLNGGAEVVTAGPSAIITLVAEGVHSINYFAVDNEGNREASKTLTVRIDTAAPTISASASPGPNTNGWNNTDVTISYSCSDISGGSGVDSAASSLGDDVLSASGAASGTCVDNAGNSAAATKTVQIDKTPPAAAITAPGDLSVNAVGVSATFSCTDVLSGMASCNGVLADGTTSTPDVDYPSTSGTTFTLTAAGVYTLIVAATDRAGNAATATRTFVVYDPSAGFVTGGGWINSPPDACTGKLASCPAGTTGRANFGFVSQYKKGVTVPTGNTEFQFQAGGLNFKSTSYEWLVVSGAKAQFKGSGTINGAGSYDFHLTVTDGDAPGGGGADKFRIRITGPSGVVYDNQPNGDPASLDAGTAISGGSIVIH